MDGTWGTKIALIQDKKKSSYHLNGNLLCLSFPRLFNINNISFTSNLKKAVALIEEGKAQRKENTYRLLEEKKKSKKKSGVRNLLSIAL